MKIEKVPCYRNEKHGRAETTDRTQYFGNKRKKDKQG
jgi:hypothetical protein